MNAILIASPNVDFPKFLLACDKLLPRRPSDKADLSPRKLTDAERFLMCLEGFRDNDEESQVGLHMPLTFLVWAPHERLLEFLEICSLPFVKTSATNDYRFAAAIVTGNLTQWKWILQYRREVLDGIFNPIENALKGMGLKA